MRDVNKHNGGILLYTLTFSNKDQPGVLVIDKSFIIDELKSRGTRKITLGCWGVDGKRRKRGKTKKKLGDSKVDPFTWLNKEYGTSKDGNPYQRNYCYLLFFLTILCEKIFLVDEEDRDYWFYKNLSWKKLESFIPNSKGQLITAISILEAAEIIVVNPHYQTNTSAKKRSPHATGYPQSYKVHPRFLDDLSYSRMSFKGMHDIDATFIPNNKWIKKGEFTPIPNNDFLQETIEANLLAVGIENYAVDQYNNMRLVAGYPLPKSSIVQTVHSFAALSRKNRPSEIIHQNVKANWSKSTGRLYHNLSSFPRELRYTLSIKGASIWQVDVTAAHAFLLINLYKKSLELSEKPSWPEKIRKERKKYLQRFNYKTDFYLKIGEIGKIPRASSKQTDKDYRQMIKDAYWSFVFGDVKSAIDCVFTKAYQTLCPILLQTINHLKKEWWIDKQGPAYKRIQEKLYVENRKRIKDGKPELTLADKRYKQIAYSMQQLEGEIILSGVCNELANWKPRKSFHPKKIWFLPLHDALWVQQCNVRYARQIMRKHWEKHLGQPPILTANSIAGELDPEDCMF
jgi:hypothetical protein